MTKQRRWIQSAIDTAANADFILPWTRRKAAVLAVATRASAKPAQPRLAVPGLSSKLAAR
ncbi:hypothetical protein L0V05_16800 [Tabrizicola sp. J26]|uniref:hypothetical protein n=1 Tax=Alitabrizicola rongguiensis TaxID=2909234 RepID=UPI001F1F217F|nr:hypothetical protein [Tabrizicola rongguiensis]MCF1710469.1 hypothetical protein [Tabrizicola rongguiensis]